MESGRIADDQISASSVFDSNHGQTRARLNQPSDAPLKGAWSARSNNQQQWIQVTFPKKTVVTAVITQGRADYGQWVEQYSVEYTQDGFTWNYINDYDTNTPKVSIFIVHCSFKIKEVLYAKSNKLLRNSLISVTTHIRACNTLEQWNVIMYANVTLPIDTGFKQKETYSFSPWNFNGIKIITAFKYIFQGTMPKLSVNMEIISHKSLTRTNILVPFVILVLLHHNTVTIVDRI